MNISSKYPKHTKTCSTCQQVFYRYYEIDGKLRDLWQRKNCLNCQPYKSRKENKHNICGTCGRPFPINFKNDLGNYICLSGRANCLDCSPILKKDLSHLYDKMKDNYPKFGSAWCQKEYDLTKNQVFYIVQKFDLKVSPEVRSKLLSIGHTKSPEECRVNHSYLTNVDNSIKAYIWGLLWTDGSISPDNNTINFSTTSPDVETFQKFFMLTGLWQTSVTKSKNNWKDKHSIYTTNKWLRDWMEGYGFLRKEEGFLKLYNLIPQEHQKYFIRGVIDGDGCFFLNEKSSNFSFSVCSNFHQNWDCLELFFNNLNLRYSIERSKTKSGSYSKIHLRGKLRIEKFGDIIYKDYDQDRVGLYRKYDKYIQIKSKCNRRRFECTLL